MSRNIDKANQNIFDNIILYYLFSDESVEDSDLFKNRYIFGTKEEKNYLKNFKIETNSCINIWNNVILAFARYQNERYLISIGIEQLNTPNGIDKVDLNAGIFTAIVSDFNLMVNKNISANIVAQKILSLHVDADEYIGHSFNDLIFLFPQITIYKINDQVYSGDINSLEQMACIVLSHNKALLSLPFSDNTLESFRELCCHNYSTIKYDNLLQAITSTNFKFAFLDIYRSIEMLYQVCYITDIEKNVQNIDRDVLLKAIDTHLSWKPNERNSLVKIINSLKVSDKPVLFKQISKVIKETSGQICVKEDAIINWIYDLRCNIVHLKTYHPTLILTNKNWDTLLYVIIEFVSHAYHLYD